MSPCLCLYILTNISGCKATSVKENNHSGIIIFINWSVDANWNFGYDVIVRLQKKQLGMRE